jgi:hypothetical protein
VGQLQLPPRLDERALAGKLAAAGAVLLVLAIAVTGVTGRVRHRQPTSHAPPALVVGEDVSALAAGFGSLWAADETAGHIVRIDPQRRTVLSRILARDASSVSVGLGAVWANAHGTLLEIDPRTDAIRARVPVETPDGVPYKTFDVVPTPAAIWLVQPRVALRLDPRTLELRGTIRLTDRGAEAGAWAAAADGLWTVTALGSLQRYDLRTGRRVASVPSPVPAASAIAVGEGAVVVLNASGDAARIDPSSGRAIWRAHLATRVGAAGVHGPFLVTKGADAKRPRDLLLRTDLASGRPVSQMAVTDLGSEGHIQFAGRMAWMTAFGGKLVGARL